MDPSIIKLLEEDEDECMHSGADIDAFTEALNRDIQGDDFSNPKALLSDAGVLSKDNLHFTEPHLPQLEQIKISSSFSNQLQHSDRQLECNNIMLQHGNTFNSELEHPDDSIEKKIVDSPLQNVPQHSEDLQQKVQQFNSQPPPNTNQTNTPMMRMMCTSSLQLDILVPELQPHLDKDRSMQLQALYTKLLNNEISKEQFLKVCKNIVGDRMIREAAVHQVQMQQVQAQAAWQANQKQYSSHAQSRVQSQSKSHSLMSGSNIKVPSKNLSIGQKRAIQSLGNSLPQASKKQKTTPAFLGQSIEQLNDVTAVSGVNLSEEEEQLLSAPIEVTRASEAIQRVVEEEEERSIMQKEPLQKKLAQIISRCGLRGVGNNVEHCLSLCVEERLRHLVENLIRLSKQRTDVEKRRHQLVVTSDVQHQILMLKQKAKEEWQKKQAEELEKLQKFNYASFDSDVENVKDDRHSKTHKLHHEDDKMRATAANAAARAAIGVDDMLSKWQLMAEQARQKCEGKLGEFSNYQKDRSSDGKHSTNFEENLVDQREGCMKGAHATAAAGGMSRSSRNTATMSHTKDDRTICIKDVIAALEKEPWMCKSSLIYHLYERASSNLGPGLSAIK